MNDPPPSKQKLRPAASSSTTYLLGTAARLRGDCESGNRVSAVKKRSEAESCAKLELTRRVGIGDLTEASPTHAGSRVLPVNPIENVECICLERKIRPLSGESEGLAQRHIPRVVPWADDVAYGSVASTRGRLQNERRRVEPAHL